VSNFSALPVSPYDPNTPDYDPQTLSLDEVIKQGMLGALLETFVAMPAKIVAIVGEQQVDIQPLTQTHYKFNAAATDRPIIRGVPVCMAVGTNYSIKLPIAVGDLGIALMADRSIDPYLQGDGSATYDPADIRVHDYNDAMFLPGLPTYSTQTQDGTTDLVVTNGESQGRFLANGKVQFKNQSQELLDLFDQVLSQLSTLVNDISIATVGPTGGPLLNAADFVPIGASLMAIQTSLSTLKV